MGSTPQDPKTLRFGAPGADDSGRSGDEIRIIHEMAMQDVEAFLQQNQIDRGAADQLRKEPPHIMLAVLDRGPLRACRDPSTVLVARIRAARNGTLGPAPLQHQQNMPPPAARIVDPNASEVDQFIAANGIDHAASAALKKEPPHIQNLVLSKGSLVGKTTNPSASLIARIRYTKEKEAGIPQPMMTPGMQPMPQQQPMMQQFNPGTAMAESQIQIAESQISGGRPSQVQIGNVDDKRLQEEALKAIQGLGGVNPNDL